MSRSTGPEHLGDLPVDRLSLRWPISASTIARKGRGARASRDLSSGEVVLQELPYACVVTDALHESVCHYCFRDRTGDGAPCRCPCDRCYRAWYCTEECRALDSVQHEIECRALDIFLRSSGWDEPDQRSEIRLLLRILSRRFMERAAMTVPPGHRYSDEHVTFEDFDRLCSNRRCHGQDSLARLRAGAVVVRSLDAWVTEADEELIVDTLLRTQTNTFAVENDSSVAMGSGVYLEASIFNHSCRPNVVRRKEAHGPGLEFRTACPVLAGTELTINYVPDGTLAERRARLADGYHFHCDCERCLGEQGSVL